MAAVNEITVAGSAWVANYTGWLDSNGHGHSVVAGLGYTIPQTDVTYKKPLPWINLDKISLTFDEAPDSIIITGTLSPDATGTYFRSGIYGGQPAYERADGAYWIWWLSGSFNWIISTSKGGLAAGWWRAAPVTGAYTPWVYTGTAYASPTRVEVTGTCSPDVTGFYVVAETINGYPSYDREDGLYAIWYYSGLQLLTPTADKNGSPVDFFYLVGTSPVGTYAPDVGDYTGSPAAAIHTGPIQSDLSIIAGSETVYSFSAFAWDSTNLVGTWTLDNEIADIEKVLLLLDSAVLGRDWYYRFDVLAYDVDQNGVVDATDTAALNAEKPSLFLFWTDTEYLMDIDGDGTVSYADYSNCYGHEGNSLDDIADPQIDGADLIVAGIMALNHTGPYSLYGDYTHGGTPNTQPCWEADNGDGCVMMLVAATSVWYVTDDRTSPTDSLLASGDSLPEDNDTWTTAGSQTGKPWIFGRVQPLDVWWHEDGWTYDKGDDLRDTPAPAAITDDYHIHYGADEAHATNAGRNADHAIQYTEAAAITVEVCYTGTAAPADLQVTGTLSPDATGYYRRNGTYNGQPCYERLDGAYWIWWGGREPPAGGLDEWVLGTTKGSSGDSWHAGWSISGTTSPAVAGDYWPNGTYDTYKDGVGTGPQMWTDNTGQYLTDTPTWDYMWAGDLMPNVYWRREGTYTPTAGGVGTPTGTAVCVAKPITSTYKPANGYPAAPSGDATITDISLSSITVTEDVQVDGGTFDGHDVDLYCKNTKGSKQNAIIITGTLSPDATGTYLPNGTYGGGGSTAYERTDGAYWIYEYYLSPTIRWWMMGVNKGDMVDAWRHWAWNLPVTGDDFDPIGTYTGTATAAWNTSELVLGEGVWHLSEWNTATNIVVGSDGNRICHTRRGPSQMEPLAHHAIEIGAF